MELVIQNNTSNICYIKTDITLRNIYIRCIRFQVTSDPCNSISLIGTIYSLIAPFYALNRILFSSANETALQKHNNQSDFKARLKKPIKLQ